MALTNLDKNTLTNLFNMLNTENRKKEYELINFKKNSNIYCQLNLISRQIENLKIEAFNLIDNFNINEELQAIECNIKKVPGTTYYLYSKNNKKFLSIISPSEWKNNELNYEGVYYFDYDYQFYKK